MATLVYIYRLNSRQQKAIPALLAHPTTKGAATSLGINEMTLIRWLKQPDFEAAYREARYVMMDESFSMLQKASIEAVSTVMEIMRDSKALASTRLDAAKCILDMGGRSRQIQDLEERIAALESPTEPDQPAEAA